MPTPKLTSIQVRRGTKAEWEEANPQLLEGEIGLETNTYRIKVGHRDDMGHLIFWNDLRYQAPFAGHVKPVYPQDGDFWIEEGSEELYFFDGEVWRNIVSRNADGDIIINGGLNMENGCVKGDLLPCADATFNLGSPDKRWKELHMGLDDQDDFKINVGVSTDPENVNGDFKRLQLNGDDIAVRSDFGRIDTRDLDLWRSTDINGDFNPVPEEYYEFTELNTKNLPPQGNISSQAQYNEWVLASLLKIVGRDTFPGEQKAQFWNDSYFELKLNAQQGVTTPITASNVTDYPNATVQSTYFHKADGSVSERLPLEQSYWIDVPRL